MKKLLYIICLIFCWGYSVTIIAQPQFFRVDVENVGQAFSFSQSGVFNTPDDAMEPGPITPGQSYSFTFDAAPGTYLSFATMFVQSNDLFVAPDDMGILLYDDMGNPIEGDRTDALVLWDPGTEINELPGIGESQAPRQSGPNTGDADPDATVRIVNDGFAYPPTTETLLFTLTHNGGTSFTAMVANIAADSALTLEDGTTAPVIYAPGVYVVHTDPSPIFTTGEPDLGLGLEGLAEDGDPAPLFTNLQENTGVTSVLAPGIFAIHGDSNPLFTNGEADFGMGLEAIAEDGSPAALVETFFENNMMTAGAFAIPEGADGPGPLTPGGTYSFVVASGPTGRLSLATMFVQSNDLFYAFGQNGIALFDDAGPISGDITASLSLWDAGTELNEIPGIGVNQAPRQAGANTGEMDPDNTVRIVNDEFEYPATEDVIQVSITPLESSEFTVTIENVSTASTLPVNQTESVAVPLSPGAWVLHSSPAPFFTTGSVDRGQGIEDIAEDGSPAALGEWFGTKMGTPSGVFNTPVDGMDPAPIFPGEAYEFTFTAAEGMYLNLATMFVQSNDLFYAPDENGIPLFIDGAAISGDITEQFLLWDAGTELNEQPGAGENQAPRQMEANTGEIDVDTAVRLVNDAFMYPNNADIIRVTINNVVTSISDFVLEDDELLGLKVFPNPIVDQATIQLNLPNNLDVGIDLFDVYGRFISSVIDIQHFDAGETNIQLENNVLQSLQAGTYILRLQNYNGSIGSAPIFKIGR